DAIVATGKPVVAVLVNGRPLAITELEEQADAILESWYLGTEMGNSVADILFGKVNPSGKLPVSFPRSVGQIPVYYNYRRTGRPHSESNHYTTGYIDSPFTPLYPFGYGLSYSDFEYSDIQLSSTTIDAHSQVIVSALITNRSDLAGTEIVQLYIHDPLATVTRPVRELKGFERITLPAGESRRVEFKLEASELSFYNARMEQITEAGEFRVFIAPSSAEDGLETHFTLSEDWLPVRDSREEQ
ncbi:glycoside hydrolase family 3 C-terminal domain-containing protein, partial [bacterium]|nr:glycoside hydrolase family 3 C-terminal domain-containing protein [bacterium]